MPKLWGFVQEPQKALYLSGQNFIEHSALGLMTTPQPLYTEYSFGDFYGDDLDKIRIPAFNKLNNLHKIRLNFFEKIISQACQKLNKKPEDLKILDVGCNTGRDLQLLNGENKYKHLYGIDIDKKSLDVLNKLIKKDELNNIKIAEIDFLNPNISTELAQKLGNNKFDVLNFSATLEHLINPELACKHFSEILAPGGVLILTSVPDIESVRGQFEESYGDFQKPTHYYYYSKESLKTMGNKFGLDFVPMTELLPCFSKLDLLYEEVFPAIKNGKWHFFNKPLPENIKFEDVFVKNTPPNLNVFFKDPDFKMLAAGVNFRYFKNYNKNLEAFNLIYKEFFYNSIKNPQKAKEYVKQLKENLFNLFILDKPKDFDYEAIDKLENYSLALLTKKYSEKVGNFYTIDGYWTKK
jgi:SAM-dependent methyltransferase